MDKKTKAAIKRIKRQIDKLGMRLDDIVNGGQHDLESGQALRLEQAQGSLVQAIECLEEVL